MDAPTDALAGAALALPDAALAWAWPKARVFGVEQDATEGAAGGHGTMVVGEVAGPAAALGLARALAEDARCMAVGGATFGAAATAALGGATSGLAAGAALDGATLGSADGAALDGAASGLAAGAALGGAASEPAADGTLEVAESVMVHVARDSQAAITFSRTSGTFGSSSTIGVGLRLANHLRAEAGGGHADHTTVSRSGLGLVFQMPGKGLTRLKIIQAEP